MRLNDYLEASAARAPQAPAALEPDGSALAYGDLARLADAVRSALNDAGVQAGDRIGLCLPKNIAALAGLFGVLKAGCAYIPVDYAAPLARCGFIFNDCGVRAIIADEALAEALTAELEGDWRRASLAPLGNRFRRVALIARAGPVSPSPPDLAYILYTSGSTGRPKGVMHTHASARAFIDWCSQTFSPRPQDRFSSHAPFHFDLSILDLFVPIKHGASVVLIDSETGRQPGALTRLIGDLKITCWYSTPSILRAMLEHGNIASADCSSLRIVNFAGEVFPMRGLRSLMAHWPHPQFYNLYGPTETNVCTAYRLPSPLPEEMESIPIGFDCSGDRGRVVDPAGADVADGEEGELLVAGGSVMLGYWNLPERNAAAFSDAPGGPWYRTGDIVRRRPDGAYDFLGRRDRMVKRRGYRVELGEIEAVMNKHPSILETAAVARSAGEGELEIVAFYAWSGEEAPSLIKLKQFCARNLPLYMVPDKLIRTPALPKTSTDKIDYQRLKDMA